MSQTKISRKTKASLLTEVREGRSIAPFYFAFLGRDIPFTESLLVAANESRNELFLGELRGFIANSNGRPNGGSGKTKAANPQPQTSDKIYDDILEKIASAIRVIKKAPPVKYNPTGQSIEQYIKSRNENKDANPTSIRCVSGGLPSLGKRSK